MGRAEENILDYVMTTKEASERYDIADCTFRAWIKEGLFASSDIRKSGTTWLLKKSAVEGLLRQKNLYGKLFTIGGDEVYAEFLGFRQSKLQIWFEDDRVKALFDHMPYRELIPQMFEAFLQEKKMKIQWILIDNNMVENDNWLFRKEKVWALTTKAVIDTVLESLISKGVDPIPLTDYLQKTQKAG